MKILLFSVLFAANLGLAGWVFTLTRDVAKLSATSKGCPAGSCCGCKAVKIFETKEKP